MGTIQERLDKPDGEMAPIRTLVLEGMCLLADFQREDRKAHSEARKELKAPAEAQTRAEATLQALIQVHEARR